MLKCGNVPYINSFYESSARQTRILVGGTNVNKAKNNYGPKIALGSEGESAQTQLVGQQKL